MIQRTSGQIARMVDGELLHLDASTPVKGVSTDSRKLVPGNLYIPLQGARVDGHQFVSSLEDGQISLWQKDHPNPPQRPLILVEDTLKALQDLARAYAMELDSKYIAITGSNGKTSTKDWLQTILSGKWKTQKTQGNHNNEIGVPLTLLELDEDCQIALIEMGMEKAGEITFLTNLCKPDIAVITSIGSAHLENFEDKTGIARAKYEIADRLEEDEPLFYPVSSKELQQVIEEDSSRKLRIPFDIQTQPEKLGSLFEWQGEEYFIPAFGFQAINAALAIQIASYLGMEPQLIRQGLNPSGLSAHRGQMETIQGALIIDDSYKSNPESALKALEMLAAVPAKRKIAVLSDMLDLGEQSDQLHEILGKQARELGISIMSWGKQARYISKDGGIHFESKNDLAKDLFSRLDENTAVLIKGSNSMKMWEVLEALREEENGKD